MSLASEVLARHVLLPNGTCRSLCTRMDDEPRDVAQVAVTLATTEAEVAVLREALARIDGYTRSAKGITRPTLRPFMDKIHVKVLGTANAVPIVLQQAVDEAAAQRYRRALEDVGGAVTVA